MERCRRGGRMGVPCVVAGLRVVLGGPLLPIWPVPRLSQVDHGAGLGELVQTAPAAAAAAPA